MEHFDIVVVGGGPAGLTAAVYARRAGKTVLVLEKESIGGQIASSPKVENFPGMAGIAGMELSERFYTQAEELGARIELEEVLEVRNVAAATEGGAPEAIGSSSALAECDTSEAVVSPGASISEGGAPEAGSSPSAPMEVITDYGSYTCSALILATGMKHRTLGLPREHELAGVSYCAVCDGAFYAGRDVAVCGGGNTALQDAIYLSDVCRSVTLIHRRDEFRADPVLVEAVKRMPNVTLILDTVIDALQGESSLTGLALKNVKTGEASQVEVGGLFVAVGQQPEGKLAQALGVSDAAGFIPAEETCVTSVAGVFAAGDCRAKDVRQLTTACADGSVAALAACNYVNRIS